MAKYRVTAPDGQQYMVTAPDGASQQDIYDFMSQQPSIMNRYNPSTGHLNNPTEGMTGPQLAAAGAGASVADVGRGLEQFAADVGNKVGLVPDSTLANIQQDIDSAKQLDEPLLQTGAGKLGYMGGTMATTMLPFGVAGGAARMAGRPLLQAAAESVVNPRSYGAASTVGALTGLTRPVASSDWNGGVPFLPPRLLNTVAGAASGALGNLGANVLGRVAAPFMPIGNADDREAVDILKAAGIPLDLSQRTGSTFLKRVKMATEDNPVTGGAAHAANMARQTAFNKAVLGTAGVDADAATRDVMGPAMDKVNGQFESILNRNTVPIDQPFIDKLGTVQSRAQMLNKSAPSNVVNHIFDVALKKGELSGQTAYSIKKDIDGLLKSDDSTERDLGGDLHNILMDQFHGNMPAADQAALTQARQQFRILKTIEPAISKDGRGNISPSLLANQVAQKRNRGASVYGRGPDSFLNLVDLAQSGRAILPDAPNSYSFTRGQMDLLPLAKGLLLGKPAQALLHSGSNYLESGLPNGAVKDLLQLPQTSPLVGGALRRLPGSVPYNSLASSLLSQELPATQQ